MRGNFQFNLLFVKMWKNIELCMTIIGVIIVIGMLKIRQIFAENLYETAEYILVKLNRFSDFII